VCHSRTADPPRYSESPLPPPVYFQATVTVCHSRTADLAAHVRRASWLEAAPNYYTTTRYYYTILVYYATALLHLTSARAARQLVGSDAKPRCQKLPGASGCPHTPTRTIGSSDVPEGEAAVGSTRAAHERGPSSSNQQARGQCLLLYHSDTLLLYHSTALLYLLYYSTTLILTGARTSWSSRLLYSTTLLYTLPDT
jgi:hypothetical protein